MRLLAISGSLRSHSSNSSLLRAFSLLTGMDVIFFEELDRIPAFNPDLESTQEFPPVVRFRQAISEAAAVLFSTPEYAHGLPGALKNALDWIVGSGEMSEKPVTLLNASSRAVYAQSALKETLFAMNAKLIPGAELTFDFPRRNMTAQELALEPSLRSAIHRSRDAIVAALPSSIK